MLSYESELITFILDSAIPVFGSRWRRTSQSMEKSANLEEVRALFFAEHSN